MIKRLSTEGLRMGPIQFQGVFYGAVSGGEGAGRGDKMMKSVEA